MFVWEQRSLDPEIDKNKDIRTSGNQDAADRDIRIQGENKFKLIDLMLR